MNDVNLDNTQTFNIHFKESELIHLLEEIFNNCKKSRNDKTIFVNMVLFLMVFGCLYLMMGCRIKNKKYISRMIKGIRPAKKSFSQNIDFTHVKTITKNKKTSNLLYLISKDILDNNQHMSYINEKYDISRENIEYLANIFVKKVNPVSIDMINDINEIFNDVIKITISKCGNTKHISSIYIHFYKHFIRISNHWGLIGKMYLTLKGVMDDNTLIDKKYFDSDNNNIYVGYHNEKQTS